MPELVEATLACEQKVRVIAQGLLRTQSLLFLGRGIHHPIALEGALKLKELSYSHAEGYAGGEMRHGPIALLAEGYPVSALVPRDQSYDRMLANIEEARARGGRVIAVCHEGDAEVARHADHVVSGACRRGPPDAAPQHDPASAPGLSSGDAPGPRRRSASESGEVGHRGVDARPARLASRPRRHPVLSDGSDRPAARLNCPRNLRDASQVRGGTLRSYPTGIGQGSADDCQSGSFASGQPSQGNSRTRSCFGAPVALNRQFGYVGRSNFDQYRQWASRAISLSVRVPPGRQPAFVASTLPWVTALDRLIARLEAHGIRYCLVGGQAVNAYVEPVVSLDLDVAVATEQLELVERLLRQEFVVEPFPHRLNVSAPGSALRVQIQIDPPVRTLRGPGDSSPRAGTPASGRPTRGPPRWQGLGGDGSGRRPSKRQKDLADIARLLEAYPALRERVPDPARLV